VLIPRSTPRRGQHQAVGSEVTPHRRAERRWLTIDDHTKVRRVLEVRLVVCSGQNPV